MWTNSAPIVEKSYAKSFGGLADGTVYSGYNGSFSYRYEVPELKKHIVDIQKAAINDRAAGTASLVGIPIYLDKSILDTTARETPLRNIVPRVTNKGRSADYDRMTVKAAADWKAEDAALVEAADTYTTHNKAIKYLYAVGRVTGPLFAASKDRMAEAGFGDFLNLEVRNKTQALIEEEENALINGNMETTDSDAPAGILKDIYDNGNKTDKTSAAPLTIADLEEMIRICRTANDSATKNGAMPNLFITDFATENKIKGLYYDAYRINAPTQTWGWGATSAVVDGVPVLGSRFMTASSGERNLAAINTNFIETRVLQDITYEELAKTNDSDKFMVKEYLTVINKFPEAMNLFYDLA